MKHLSKPQMVELLSKLEDTKKEIENYNDFDLKKLEQVAEKFISKKSEYLAGVSGGIVGMTGGIGFAKTVAGVGMVISGPAGTVLGIALAMLIFRGRGQHKLERATRKFELSKAIILDSIKNLPKNAPLETKNKLWQTYNQLIEKYSDIIDNSLSDDDSKFNRL